MWSSGRLVCCHSLYLTWVLVLCTSVMLLVIIRPGCKMMAQTKWTQRSFKLSDCTGLFVICKITESPRPTDLGVASDISSVCHKQTWEGRKLFTGNPGSHKPFSPIFPVLSGTVHTLYNTLFLLHSIYPISPGEMTSALSHEGWDSVCPVHHSVPKG